MEKIPVVLAGDADYLPFVYVTIYSILKNRKSSCFVSFIILVPGGTGTISNQTQWEFDHYEINYIEIPEQWFADSPLTIGHITRPTYYRLLIPDLLPECDKCLYLDADLLVCGDIMELYQVDVSGNYLAAGLGIDIFFTEEYERSLADYLKLPSAVSYFNAGVLVMNLADMRVAGLTGQFVECSKKGWQCQDQDVLNICCYGKIRRLHLKYNVYSSAYSYEIRQMETRFSRKELEEGLGNPYIIHYAAGSTKPWYNLNASKAQEWWQTARSALPQRLYKRIYDKAVAHTSHYQVPDLIPKFDYYHRIIIFGCGQAGQFLYSFLEQRRPGKIAAFWDNNPQKQTQAFGHVPVTAPEAKKDSDVCVIISCQSGAEEVRKQLAGLGFTDREMAVYKSGSLDRWFAINEEYRNQRTKEIYHDLRSHGMREQKTKTVSVIVPVYKGSRYLCGLFQMMEENWTTANRTESVSIQLVLVNDYPQEKLQTDSRWVRHITWKEVVNRKNSGIHFSRVQGFLHSDGEYILFLDQDDRISPVYIMEQLKALGEHDFVICNGKQRSSLIYHNREELVRAVDPLQYLQGCNRIVSPGQVLLKRAAVPEEWLEHILHHNGADDYFLWILLFQKHAKAAISDKVLYWHFLSDSSTSRDWKGMDASVYEMTDLLLKVECLTPEEAESIRNSREIPVEYQRLSEEACRKEQAYKRLLEQWMKLRDLHISPVRFFRETGIRTIAVYGAGAFGKHLYYELRGSGIHIACFLDKKQKDGPAGSEIKTVCPGEPFGPVDAIVVTPVMEYERIRSQLSQLYGDFTGEIISIGTVLWNADCVLMSEEDQTGPFVLTQAETGEDCGTAIH